MWYNRPGLIIITKYAHKRTLFRNLINNLNPKFDNSDQLDF